jgi:hypothetical protein
MCFWVRLRVPATNSINGLQRCKPFLFDVRENNPNVTDSNLSPQLRSHAAVQFGDSKRGIVTPGAAPGPNCQRSASVPRRSRLAGDGDSSGTSLLRLTCNRSHRQHAQDQRHNIPLGSAFTTTLIASKRRVGSRPPCSLPVAIPSPNWLAAQFAVPTDRPRPRFECLCGNRDVQARRLVSSPACATTQTEVISASHEQRLQVIQCALDLGGVVQPQHGAFCGAMRGSRG